MLDQVQCHANVARGFVTATTRQSLTRLKLEAMARRASGHVSTSTGRRARDGGLLAIGFFSTHARTRFSDFF